MMGGNCPSMGIERMTGQKSGNMKSSIDKCAISVIQIEPKHQGNVSQNKEHDDIQMLKNMGLTGWLKGGSIEGP